MENLSDQDAKMLPGFGPGQGIVSGQAVRFPLLVSVKEDQDLKFEAIGDEQFLKQAKEWKPDKAAGARARAVEKYAALEGMTRKQSGASPSASDDAGDEVGDARTAILTEAKRWENVREHFSNDERNFAELEAISGLEWEKKHRRIKVGKFASITWAKLPAAGVSGKKRQRLLHFFEIAKDRGV
jgi:hypothetical protein